MKVPDSGAALGAELGPELGEAVVLPFHSARRDSERRLESRAASHWETTRVPH
jgi:hypothetical protein